MRYLFTLLFIFIFSTAYSSDFFMPKTFNSNNSIILSFDEARDYHFNSANIRKYNFSTYNEYNSYLEKNNSLNLTLDFLSLPFSIGDSNYTAFLLVGTNNDALLRPDGKGAGYLTIWKQQGNKFILLAANEIYSIYGVTMFFDDNSNNIVIDSPMGDCESVFFKTTFYIKNNKVYYNDIEISYITADNIMKYESVYNKDNNRAYLLNEKSGLTFYK